MTDEDRRHMSTEVRLSLLERDIELLARTVERDMKSLTVAVEGANRRTNISIVVMLASLFVALVVAILALLNAVLDIGVAATVAGVFGYG